MTYLRCCLLIDAHGLLSQLEGEHEAAGVLLPVYACYDSLQHIDLGCHHQLCAMLLNQHNQTSADTQPLPVVLLWLGAWVIGLLRRSVCAADESML